MRLDEFLPPPQSVPTGYGLEPLTNGLALPRWNTRRELKIYPDFGYPKYSLRPSDSPTNTVPKPDRWRIGFVPWRRYTSGVTEQPYESPAPTLWAPYGQSVLKGDLPIIGQDIFLDLTASAETVTQFRRVPTPRRPFTLAYPAFFAVASLLLGRRHDATIHTTGAIVRRQPFGGWKHSLFGDHHIYGPEGVRFYTRYKAITQRWPTGARRGAEYVMPTLGR